MSDRHEHVDGSGEGYCSCGAQRCCLPGCLAYCVHPGGWLSAAEVRAMREAWQQQQLQAGRTSTPDALKAAIRDAYAEADADSRPVLDVDLLRDLAESLGQMRRGEGLVLVPRPERCATCPACSHDWERHGTEAGGCIECRCRRTGGVA